ncbi:YtxH domain-containing protein [Aquimarina brevivitae]|uniref:Gas vesicle protein n=1 Tax=Aquimarina brevivitae TaxID=323412 RepID=A0A4Q7NUZ1_9FLAO|nr:YtxH domain-containing protein [Aquimarina brevivitae]RZS90760.1 gas vesicle protein [Aquimarina brevivitae]
MSNTTNTLLGVLAGTAVGATLGILFAPDKGSKTREKIQDSALKARDEISDRATTISDELTSRFTSEKKQFQKDLDGLVDDMSMKADDVITSLEKKLETMKERNNKISAN